MDPQPSRMRGRRPLTAALVLLALLATGPAASAQTAGALDPSLVDPSIDGYVTSIAPMADGRIVVAGSFTALGLTTQWSVARIAINGTPDADFANPNVNGTVNAAALQPDGKVVIVGIFSSVGGTGAGVNGVARLTAYGTRDAGFANPGALGGANLLRAVAVQPDGKILIAGNFTSVGASPRSRIARLNADGTLDSGFGDVGVDTLEVRAIALQPDGKIIIGGDFTAVGSTAMSGVARLNADGTLDTSFANPRITLTSSLPVVNALALRADGKIVIGGQFSHVGGSPYAGAARLNADGTRDATFANPQIAGGGTAVNALAVQADGKVIIGGNFATVGGQTYGRVARLNADGTPDTGFENPTANSFASSIALQPDGKALIGGNFTTIRGTAAGYLARVFATSPQAAPTGVTATAGDGQATVSWTAIPGAITGYTATASPGGATCATTTATSCTITGLANGTTYTVAVTAENAFGSGPAASASAVLASRTAAAAAAAKPSVTVTAPKARVTATGVIVTSQVTVSGAGRISQTATTGTKKFVVHCRVTTPVAAAGTYTLRCDLGAKGRTALRLRALKLTLRTVFTPTGADALTANRSITVKRRR